jgi:uncharacterized membrane protein YfcA
MHMPVSTAMPTSQLKVLISTVGGVVFHVASGNFVLALAPLVLLGGGALLGAQLGAALSERISGVGLVRLMALALMAAGIRLLLSPFV